MEGNNELSEFSCVRVQPRIFTSQAIEGNKTFQIASKKIPDLSLNETAREIIISRKESPKYGISWCTPNSNSPEKGIALYTSTHLFSLAIDFYLAAAKITVRLYACGKLIHTAHFLEMKFFDLEFIVWKHFALNCNQGCNLEKKNEL